MSIGVSSWSEPVVRVGDWERRLAGLVLFLLLVKVPGAGLFPASVIVALVALPLIVHGPHLTRLTRWLIPIGLVTASAGYVLRLMIDPTKGSPGEFSASILIALWVLSMPLIIVLGLWCIVRTGYLQGAVLLAAGATLSTLLNAGGGLQWKGSVGIFVTMLLVTLAAGRPLIYSRLVLVAATIANALTDARSMALITAIALGATFLNARTLGWVRRRPVRSFLLAIVSVWGLAALMLTLMQSGVLGAAIQARTISQMRGGQSVILGGRAEWAATLDLLGAQPQGFGVGVSADSGLQSGAVAAAGSVGGDIFSGYYRTYVFGERTDLHSQLADTWFHFGWLGVLLIAVLIATVCVGAPYAIGSMRAAGVTAILASLVSIWDLLFSPMADSDRSIAGIVMAAAIVLYSRARQRDDQTLSNARSDLTRAMQ